MATLPAVSRPARRQEVAAILGDIFRKRPSHSSTEVIPISYINIFEQTRKTFDPAYIDWLAEDIRSSELKNPLQVVRYTPENFGRFLQALNWVWGTRYRARHFRSVHYRGRRWYFALIAGECRIRALQQINVHTAKVTLGTNIDPGRALLDQDAENQHLQPPAHEQAFAWQRKYRVIKLAFPSLTLAAFARHVHRSADTVKRALQFCELPDSVQFAVQRGEVPYGIAVQLTRLNGRLREVELREYLRMALTHSLRVPEFRAMISRRIEEMDSGQGLLSLMEVTQERESRKAARRRTVDKQYLQGFIATLRYMQLVSGLVQRGELGTDESPYATGSVRHTLRQVIDTLEVELPHLQKVMRRLDVRRAEAVIPKLRQALS